MTRVFAKATVVVALVSLSGCLQTRTAQKEVEEKQVLKNQVKSLQTMNADVTNRFNEVDAEFRKMNGRIEAMETKQNQGASQKQDREAGIEARLTEIDKKMTIYQEAISKLDTQVSEMSQKMASLEAGQKSVARDSDGGGGGGGKGKSKGTWDVAEDAFGRKDWKDAILNYEKYRKSNPKGKEYPMATYKIGVAFQELGLVDDAKAFYEEVLAKFPKSTAANKAGSKLKTMKK